MPCSRVCQKRGRSAGAAAGPMKLHPLREGGYIEPPSNRQSSRVCQKRGRSTGAAAGPMKLHPLREGDYIEQPGIMRYLSGIRVYPVRSMSVQGTLL